MRKAIDLTKFTNGVKKSVGVSSGFRDPDTWVSTGNYILNYFISGDFKRGVPLGKLTMFAGASGSGKSYIVSGNIARECQRMGITPIIIDTENALDEDWLQRLGVDTSEGAMVRLGAARINQVGSVLSEFIKEYKASYMTEPEEERPKYMFIVDSLGMLLTETDIDQFERGDMKGDMGRKPKQLAALVRNTINLIADCNIGVVCTNHTYASQDMFNPDDKVSGGEGIIFGSSIVVASKKFKLKEDEEGNKTTDVLGIRTTFSVMKTRYGRPFEKADVHIRFDSGLDEYSGLLDYFERIGVVTKDGNKLKYVAKDGTEYKEFRKRFGDDILEVIINEWDYEEHRLISKRSAEAEESLLNEEAEEGFGDFMEDADMPEESSTK